MAILISEKAPDFVAKAVLADNSIDSDFRLSSMHGKYIVLFFYPLDFSFVCPTEILAFDEQIEAFKSRDAEIVGVSVDSVYSHLAWKKTPVTRGGIGAIRFPLVSDLKKEISLSYGVLAGDGAALRSLFLIDRNGFVRHAVHNDPALGRSVTETLRMLDAVRFYDQHGRLCPADWQQGDDGVKPTTDGAIDFLSRFARKKSADGQEPQV
ncbi:MAG: peroxiredoxin [Acidobacteria bacterium]|nr:peroxiredoxin [Acidobacteriota bacterium]